MKNYTILVIFIISLVLSSCDDLLKEEIYGQVPSTEYWNSEKDADMAIKAAYASVKGGWQGLSIWQFVVEDLGTDIGVGGYFSTTSYSSYTGWSSTTPDFVGWGIWPTFWETINYANTVIDNVPGMDIDETVKNRVLGEAFAIRAMVYFYLTNWFGGMPEVITATEAPLEIPRQTVESNYLLMESDLTKAIAQLPTKSELIEMGEADYGRLTKHAAMGLLARVYLQQGKWADCVSAAQEVINSGEYQLEETYTDIFSLGNEGFSNSEVIWVLPFVAGSSPVVDGVVLQVYIWKAPENTDYSAYYEWNGDIRADAYFYATFPAGDQRRDGLESSADAISDPIMLTKYPADPSTDGQFSGTDYPFVRLADVMLMKAEAHANLGELPEAVAEINKVRERALISNLDPAAFTQETLLTQIYRERRWELYFEGHAKRDMIRLNYSGMIDHIKLQSSDWETYSAERYLLLPLPANALAANPGLTQNPDF